MSRDYRRLTVFHESHALATAIYLCTRDFPRDEWFGLRSQMQRAAASVACNIVEGNARSTTRDYVRFLNVAFGSASELQYLVALATDLGIAKGDAWPPVRTQCETVTRQLQRLVERMETMAAEEASGGIHRQSVRKD